MGYFNANSIGEISSITTNTMETLGDVAARVVMLTMQGILETSMIILMLFIFDWRIGLIAAAGVLIFFGVNSVMQNAGKKDSEQKVVCDTELVNRSWSICREYQKLNHTTCLENRQKIK
ncbi:ABC transporter, permease/ATP-binding protein [human gut metagenome]|uniref:ABC transporter, permease/ATP-binding protein n=1 Tax=human gut metagenome TaxID=408170 RepID=K1TGD8_9ZZZZ